jgi:hypothetical protein
MGSVCLLVPAPRNRSATRIPQYTEPSVDEDAISSVSQADVKDAPDAVLSLVQV